MRIDYPKIFFLGWYWTADSGFEFEDEFLVGDFVVASDRDFWGWQSPALTSPEEPQIATMKEKPSHHPKRESRALQIRFGGTEVRSTRYESDPRTVNFISVLPLIQKESRNGQDITGNISMPDFQIIYPIVKSTYVCVYDQPGDEATFVKKMVSDRSTLALPEYHIDLVSENSGVAVLEPSRSIRLFLKFLQNPWQRDVWTSDAALVGGGLETYGLATQIVWGVCAETFVFDAALEDRGVLFVHARAKLP
ncbi:hypothetical protein F2Q69_00022240 [Brassica cretica]|uniref:Uncharacterized protein n=1 Tax=Brassica cretica TaxID=69181 RepID=A0A8S9QBI7_BRACR|nr:hypothetical protein F2Q69_00022240 [Brassica cretica]